MKKIPFLLIGLLPVLLLLSCNPAGDLAYGIDPETEVDMLNRALYLGNAQLHEGAIPESSGTLSISSYPEAVEVSAGVVVYLPYSTSQNGDIEKVYIQISGANSYWEVPVQKDSLSNLPFISAKVPHFIKQGNWNVVYAIKDRNGNISPIINTQIVVSPVVQCNTGIYGQLGITVRSFILGDKAGAVNVTYDMYSIPDRLDLKYNGQWIRSTGTILSNSSPAPTCNLSNGFVSGSKTLSFAYDPNISRTLEVYVSGCYSGTEWIVDVDCP